MRVVVTGGAGYIGSHVVRSLIANGYEPIIIDNLSSGCLEFIPKGVSFKNLDVTNNAGMKSFFLEHKSISGVIHLAGLKYAGESTKKPLDFYSVNSYGVACTLRSMQEANVDNFVFSSSCSVYGEAHLGDAVNENASLEPQSPYGRSKVFAESIIADQMQATGLKAISLRYFNVAGNGKIIAHDRSPYNLFPNIYRAIDAKGKLKVYKSALATLDGSCIRDYVDVSNLANMHVTALTRMLAGETSRIAYNLGSEVGTSTLEIAEAAKKLYGLDFELLPSREGDPSIIMANSSRAKKDLGWSHTVTIEEMLQTGYQAWQAFRSFNK